MPLERDHVHFVPHASRGPEVGPSTAALCDAIGRQTAADRRRNARDIAPNRRSPQRQGEVVDPATHYFRISGFFETAAPKYDWLNRIVCLGIGQRQAGGPVYSVFEML
jgi:hypothetical protein